MRFLLRDLRQNPVPLSVTTQVFKILAYLGLYAFWIVMVRLFILTLITYFLMSDETRLQDISEVFGSNEILIAGFSSLSFLIFLRILYPLFQAVTTRELRFSQFQSTFVPSCIRGVLLGLAIPTAYLLTGYYRFLGYFIQFDEVIIALGSFGLRAMILLVMVYCEEFIFREKVLKKLIPYMHPLHAVWVTALCYCLIKFVQFDLGIMQSGTLFLLSIILGLRAVRLKTFVSGAGFLVGLLVVLHPVLGLPIFGSEFSGIFLIQYRSAMEEYMGVLGGFFSSLSMKTDARTALFITGGIGGPLSGFALQLVFVVQIFRELLRQKKSLLNPVPTR